MLRSSIALPLFLSALVLPAAGETSTTHCSTFTWTTPRCEAERAREFAAARNAEIKASIARVAEVRDFEKARNAEINASIAAVKAERARVLALSLTHCKTASSTTPRCLAERAREFAAARNAEINASIARVAEIRIFEKARNAEIEASLAAVKAERGRQFARARNAEINASVARVAQIRASEFAAARNAEIDRSIAAVKAERARAFAAARNAEINSVLAAYEAQRVLRIARARMAMFERPLDARRAPSSSLETGAIGDATTPMQNDPRRTSRQRLYAEPCAEAGQPIEPLRFSASNAQIDEAMKPVLDRLALLAQSCPGVRIKIHGYTDASGPVQINRHLAALRAEAARSYLIATGVAANRIAAMGHGVPRPAGAEAVAGNQAASGHVEFSVSDLTIDASASRIMWELAEVLDPSYVPPLARLSP